MKVNIYKAVDNMGVLHKTDGTIAIRKNRWIDKNGTSHPMNFEQPVAFENPNVYFLRFFGNVTPPIKGIHISLSFWQNQRFLWLQERHWVQQKENIMWLINILVAILAIIAALK